MEEVISKEILDGLTLERFVLLRLDTTPLVLFSVFYIYYSWLHLL